MAGESPMRLGWVRSLPCCLAGAKGHQCKGRTDAHHPRGPSTGLGRKGSDADAFPMCHHLHVFEWHGAAKNGYFSGWDKARRRAWQREQVQRYRDLWPSAESTLVREYDPYPRSVF